MDSKQIKKQQKIQLLIIQTNLVYLIGQKKNKSIRQLAYVTGISNSTLNLIVKGKGNPSIRTINILNSYFNVNILQPIFIIHEHK